MRASHPCTRRTPTRGSRTHWSYWRAWMMMHPKPPVCSTLRLRWLRRSMFFSHLQTEISDSISCYMPCKQNYMLWMLMLWDCGWLIFFLLYEKAWNSCECVWWSFAMIMIAFTTSNDLSRFPPSTGERWLMRNWCVSKHTSLCFFLSNKWFQMQMIHGQIFLDVGKSEQQRIRTRSAHHREWSGGAQHIPQWSGGIGSVYHCRPGTFF